jgi:hypothetical protein
MRTTALLLALTGLGGTAAAQPNPAVRTMAVSASAPQVCAVQAPQLSAGAQVNFRGLTGSTLQIDRLVDPTTLSTNAASAEVTLNAVCNYPHRLTIHTQNNGLWQSSPSGAGATGFGNAVPYSASLTWGTQTIRLEADASTRRMGEKTATIDLPTSGAIKVKLDIQPGTSNGGQNAPLLAGFYADTLRVTVEPQ